MKDKINVILTIILLILLVFCLQYEYKSTKEENAKYIYVCTDYQGNEVLCTYYYLRDGHYFGGMEDGTVISITSYKRVLKEEVK
jgi:hypothetical protein